MILARKVANHGKCSKIKQTILAYRQTDKFKRLKNFDIILLKTK
jgi:cellobiose-specific phosphotransferase system component IIB